MNAILILVVLACTCFADKEYTEEFASLFNDELLHELEKRLMDYEEDDSLRSQSTSQCKFATEANLIIKTKVSLDQGAIFIDSPTIGDDEINPRLACQERCCATEDCNLAVFKEKSEHACYLFNCGEPSRCNFSTHDGFTSIGLTGGLKHDQMVSASKNQHAEDLANLAAKTTTTTSTTTTTPAPTKPPKKQPVPLFGTCEDDKDCAGSGTECLASYCVCADGYHPQDGICRESCTRFQFECKNDGQPLLNPQCVAIYDTCDGVEHCQDGSDEQNCAPGTKAVKQDIQQSIPQGQPQGIQSQVQPQNWFDTGDFVNGNEPLLERGRQYPELMDAPIMYQQQQQQQQQQLRQQQVLQPVAQQIPTQQQIQPGMQNVVPQDQPVPPQQVAQSVQQVIQPVRQPAQQVQQPVQVQQQQPSRPRPTVEKPPTYDYESNPPPRRQPNGGQSQQRPVPSQQGQIQSGPQQTLSVQGPQNAQAPQNIQQNAPNARGPLQQATSRKGETVGIQQVQPSGRHQSVTSKKGANYGPPGENQAPSQGATGKAVVQVQPQQNNRPNPNVDNSQQQAVPQQKQQQQQQKGYYTDGGFIPATSNNNNNNRPPANQRNQNNAYRNMFNKDRYGYQYQNPLYGGQRPYGRQYDNYDYNNYAYGEAPASNYNYEYNSGGLFDTQDTRGPSSDSTSYWPYYRDSYSRWNGFKGDGRKAQKNTGNPSQNGQTWDLSGGGSTVNRPSSGAEPAKGGPSNAAVNSNIQTQTTEVKTNQQQGTSGQSSSVGGKDDQSKVAQVPKIVSESQGSGQQQNTETKDQNVPNSESSSNDGTGVKSLSDSSDSDEKQKTPDISVAKVEVGGDGNLGIEESAVEETMESNKFSNQTAVIVLAMGLGITAILLMFVGCRLRNVKRRLRKGRPMNSNEADYLINGMYL